MCFRHARHSACALLVGGTLCLANQRHDGEFPTASSVSRPSQSSVAAKVARLPASPVAPFDVHAAVRRAHSGIPAAVLDGSSYPAVLDPVIGPELELDTAVTGPALGGQTEFSTAYDPASGNYFVVWRDTRAAVQAQVFGTRISPAGVVLDPGGIPISLYPDVYSVGTPSVVFDGTNFLVVFDTNCDVWGRRISPAGVVIGAAPFSITNSPFCQSRPAAYASGATTLVVWNDQRNDASDVYGARVVGSTVLDPAGIAIAVAPDSQLQPRVTYGAGNWLVVWPDRRNLGSDVYGARVSGTTGAVLDPAGIAISALAGSEQGEPWPTSDGNNYFVTWEDARNSPTTSIDIYGARVAATGAVLDPSGIQICNHTAAQISPSAAFGGGIYQLVWYDNRGAGLWGNRVDPATGAVLDGPAGAAIIGPAAINYIAYTPRIHAAGAGYYVAWSGGQGDIGVGYARGSRLTTAPFLLDAPGTVLASSANGEHDVAVAGDGINYLAVWRDDRGGQNAIYGARIDGATGMSLDPAGILLSANGVYEATPAVAFNGTDYLVVWVDQRGPSGIWGTRVSTAGTVMDPGGLNLFTGLITNVDPAVASDGSDWFVAWMDFRNSSTTGPDIYGGRVNALGTPLDPSGIPISNAVLAQSRPRVTFGGGYYFVVWDDFRTGLSDDIYGARVTPSGLVLEPSGIPIETGPAYVTCEECAVAYGAQNYIVTYSEGNALRRVKIDAATGTVLGTILLAGNEFINQPAIAYNSGTFVVLYRVFVPGGPSLLRGTRLDATGADIDPVDWYVTTTQGMVYRRSALAAPPSSAGPAIVAYSRYDPTPGVTSDRGRSRLIFYQISADLAVTKTDGQTTAVPGEPVTYTIAVSNSGPDAVAAVHVLDAFPGALSGTTWTCIASPGSSCTAAGSGDIDDFAMLAANGSATYTATGTISAAATGSLTNTATVTPSDANPGNNSDTDVDTLTPEADLAITKSDSADPVSPGDPLTYTLDFTNNGPSNATAVTVVDTLPGGVTFVSSVPGAPTCTLAGATLTCGIGGLTAGASGTVTVNVTVNAGASGMLVNTATVSGAETDPDTNNNTASAATAIGRRDGELSHGTDELYDLAALPGPVADEDVFRINQKPYSSYEVVIDATSGDIGNGSGPVLERLAPDGTTVIQTSVAIGTGPSRSLRWMNATPFEVEGETVRVRSAGCTTDCGPDDVYRIRAYETTYSIARFNNTGSQVTVLILQNRTSDLMVGVAIFWDLSGIPACGSLFGLGAHSTLVLDTRDCPGVNGIAGSITVANTMPYGEISGKAVALEPSNGFSFDSPLVPRLR
jgi:uncharacterized repeat protein (TIGR01451 family)